MATKKSARVQEQRLPDVVVQWCERAQKILKEINLSLDTALDDIPKRISRVASFDFIDQLMNMVKEGETLGQPGLVERSVREIIYRTTLILKRAAGILTTHITHQRLPAPQTA